MSPNWVLLARIEFQAEECGDSHFELTDSGFATSTWAPGTASPVDFGAECWSTVDCFAGVYDLDNDCELTFIGDFPLFAGCWLRCPGEAQAFCAGTVQPCVGDTDCTDAGFSGPCVNYENGFAGENCDAANFVGFCDLEVSSCCSPDNCVGPEDDPFFRLALFNGVCSDDSIRLPPDCSTELTGLSSFLPLPTDEELLGVGLQPPPRDWEGYRRGGILEGLRREQVGKSAAQRTRR